MNKERIYPLGDPAAGTSHRVFAAKSEGGTMGNRKNKPTATGSGIYAEQTGWLPIGKNLKPMLVCPW